MSNTYSAGVATAYGAAVRGGYTGTYAEWCAAMADFGDKSQQAIDAAEQAAQSATEAANSATDAADSASAAATSEGNAADSAAAAHNSETNAAASESAAAQSATGAAVSASEAATSATNAAASAAAAQAVKDSIPADYTKLSNDVSDLKSNINVVKSASGSVLGIDDAVTDSEIKAFSANDVTTVYRGSRNLFDWETFYQNAAIKQRCTLVVNSDGSVTVTSTATGSMWIGNAAPVGTTIPSTAFKIPVFNGQTIFMSKTSNINTVTLFFVDSSNTVLSSFDLRNQIPYKIVDDPNIVGVVPRVNFVVATSVGQTFNCRLGLSLIGTVNYNDNFVGMDAYTITGGALSAPMTMLPGANVVWVNSGTVSFEYDADTTTADILASVDDVSDFVGYLPLPFEYGGIVIGVDGILPDASEQFYTTRCRTNPYNPIRLEMGDVVCVKSPYLVDILSADNPITDWHSTNTEIDKSGEYAITVRRSDGAQIDVDDVIKNVCVKRMSWTIIGGVPSYYEDHLTQKIVSIQNSMTYSNGIAFAFFTDAHFPANAKNSKALIQQIIARTSVPFVIYGGDTVGLIGPESALDSAIDTLMDYQNAIGVENWYAAHGNHDFYCRTNDATPVYYTKTLKECYNIMLRKTERFITNVDTEHLCYCIDIPAQKTRFVVLNSTDTAVPSGSVVYTNAQLQWIADALKELNNTKIIVISHISSDPTIAAGEASAVANTQAILAAFKAKGTVTVGGQSISFADTTNDLICQISGHSHKDQYHVDNGILAITTTCDAAYTDDGEGMALGTITEQAIDVYLIDYENTQVKTIRIGRGSDRRWNYLTGAVLD